MDLLTNIKTIWNKISIVQRAVIIALLMASVIMSVVLTSWASKADMRPLFLALSLEEAAQITDKLAERGIDFELRANGTSIYVAHDVVYNARLELAKEGLPQSDQGGYKIFENSKISASPLVQQMNHKQALEEELAKSIQMIQGIEHARILIVTPEQSLFNQSNAKSKASVTVKLKPGWKLNSGNIAAITNLTSSAIESLTPDNVTIVDSNGKLLSIKDDDSFAPGAGTYQDYKQRVENNLANKCLEMLETVLGPGRATVKVSSDIDMSSITTQTTKYDKGVPTKETINSTTKIKSIPNSANDQEAVTLKETSTEKEEQNETEMLVGKVITSKTEVPGKVKALTVSVVVDLSMPTLAASPAPEENDTTTASNSDSQVGQAQKIMTVEQVREIVKNALGRELLAEDSSLTVVDAPFMQARLIKDAQPEMSSLMNLNNYTEIIRTSTMPAMGLFAFLSLLIMGRSKKSGSNNSSKPATSLGSEAGELLSPADKSLSLPVVGDGEAPEIAYRKHITQSLKENPDQVKQLFSSWVRQEA